MLCAVVWDKEGRSVCLTEAEGGCWVGRMLLAGAKNPAAVISAVISQGLRAVVSKPGLDGLLGSACADQWGDCLGAGAQQAAGARAAGAQDQALHLSAASVCVFGTGSPVLPQDYGRARARCSGHRRPVQRDPQILQGQQYSCRERSYCPSP